MVPNGAKTQTHYVMSPTESIALSAGKVAEQAMLLPHGASVAAIDSVLPVAAAAARVDLRHRVAIVHDWLTVYSGAERVLEQLISMHPKCNLFASIDFLADDERAFLGGKKPITSFAQHLPLMRKHYRKFLPLLMFAMEQIDVSRHELVISSSAAIAKGILTGPDQLHISYVHSPMRYAWDLQHEYLHDSGLERGLGGSLARYLLHNARYWDLRTVNGVDHFIANSAFIAKRIWKVYRREATVIYPPVDTHRFQPREDKDDYYLTASRLVPYKKVRTIVEAFSRMPHRRLVVIGDGPEMKRVKEKATPNVEILGYQPAAVLKDHMQRAKAFLFAAQEDFGISPVEAQACGTPVIAFGHGGALETIRARNSDSGGPTGLFFEAQTPEAIFDSVQTFERRQEEFTPLACRRNAERFGVDVFRRHYSNFVEHCWDRFVS
jgi:glycosyltransferase involved in cell wall biosynthesis